MVAIDRKYERQYKHRFRSDQSRLKLLAKQESELITATVLIRFQRSTATNLLTTMGRLLPGRMTWKATTTELTDDQISLVNAFNNLSLLDKVQYAQHCEVKTMASFLTLDIY